MTDASESGAAKGHSTRVVDRVVEQRVSNLAQGLLTLVTMTGPLLVVLHLIPQGVLAGLFFIMGVQALEGNGITNKLLFLARDSALTPASDPLRRITRKRAVWYFVGLELVGFGATFAITQTIAAIGFPIIILLHVPVRTFLLPRVFSAEELAILDAPTASPFTMESVGGVFGENGAAGLTAGGGDQGLRSTGSNGLEAEGEVENVVERGEVRHGSGVIRRESHRRASFRSGGAVKEGEEIEMQRMATEK